jgi:hypothetical protein
LLIPIAFAASDGLVHGRRKALNERRPGGWSGLTRADRTAIVMVGAGIVVINVILIALLF